MAKITPLILRAASLSLPASLAAVVGTVSTDLANATTGAVSLGSKNTGLQIIRLVCSYARNGGSVTGAPVFAVDGSMDLPDTAAASVSNWVPVYLLDNSSFSSGAIDGYPEAFAPKPSTTGTTTQATPPWNVQGYFWVRVRMTDFDAVNRGAITNLTMGGET